MEMSEVYAQRVLTDLPSKSMFHGPERIEFGKI
jgi:hypothetical protein